jgi:cyclophilin family peptidyl-prolyl cis-trans isomerase
LYRRLHDTLADAAAPDLATRGLLQCKAALGHDRAAGTLTLLPACGLGQVDERRRGVLSARALGEAKLGDPQSRRRALAPLVTRPESAVRAAAAEALAQVGGEPPRPSPSPDGVRKGDVTVPLVTLLVDGDPSVLAAAAEAAAKLKIPGAASILQQRYDKLVTQGRALDADSFEAALAVHDALAALGVEAGAAPLPPVSHRFRGRIPATPVVRLETTRGVIRARLFADEAPITVANFLTLAGGHFYDRLSFHRVVPGFVSQAGDPRGDGSGGPGYAIACEIGSRRYREGSLGMALSGRDTGGSQFFFTHTPQPHLDGRYTLFGEIVDGLEVVVALVEGDRIISATIEGKLPAATP